MSSPKAGSKEIKSVIPKAETSLSRLSIPISERVNEWLFESTLVLASKLK